MRPPLLLALTFALFLAPPAASAQDWNSDSALALAGRAVARRTAASADSGLLDYKARAHGFLFFLLQVGERLSEPLRLLKADQLELEVYWKAPRLSKQRIVGWRDREQLPVGMNYHIDHLGIIQNNFGHMIRFGDGDEVRDVPHPLAPVGLDQYDYALGDTLEIVLPQRSVRVLALSVRPRDYRRSRIIGTLYLDAATAALVRMAFSFTPPSYVDASIEDLSVVLDNALWEGRWWLPYRQEIEIRRRGRWLDMSARGVIRGRWEIDDYVFNLGLVDSWFAGKEITSVPPAERDSFPWTRSLDEAMAQVAEPVRLDDLERVRAEAQRIAGRRALSGLSARRFGVRRVSDLIHANRVEGLALGFGVAGQRGRVLLSYGFTDQKLKAVLTLTSRTGFELTGHREMRDIGDWPVIAPLFNSVTSQEFGEDHGDYVLAEGIRAGYRRPLGVRAQWIVELGHERVYSVEAIAEPVTGSLRPNQPLGGSRVSFARAGVRRTGVGLGAQRDAHFELTAEGGLLEEGAGYARVWGAGYVLAPVGATRVLLRAQGGAGTADLPAHRVFVLGGRATLLGDDFRRWGGRYMALGHLEWRVPVRVASVGVGPLVRVPLTITLAPYVAAGWTDGVVPRAAFAETPDVRMTAGLALELLNVFRFEAGAALPDGRVRFVFDVTRDLWDIL
jgi:hypothetical protein